MMFNIEKFYLFQFHCILLLILLSNVLANENVIMDSKNCDKGNISIDYPNVWNPKLRYYLFTSDKLSEGVFIKDQDSSSLHSSKFNKALPTRICISCWKSTVKNCKTAIIKDAYLKSGKYNFFVVDWSDWNTKTYLSAASVVDSVGKSIGNFVKFLKNNGASYDNIYLIGHDLGAHVAGAVGKYLAPYKVKTIYALDPSNILFENAPPENRLDPTDAEYVEVISTDVFIYGYGSNAPIGHAVLLPNNGRRIQPGCPKEPQASSDHNAEYCSHALAADIFANTLNKEKGKNCGIPTTWYNMFHNIIPLNLCAPCTVMGGEPAIPKKGYFYVPPVDLSSG